MKLALGIDTGGTYTDAVIYHFDEKKIMCSAKALTTKDDLSIGITSALNLLESDYFDQIEMVSLSTTLATNACVENKGGRAKLMLIGMDQWVVEHVGQNYGLPKADEILFSQPKTDWQAFLQENVGWLQDAESVAIVDIDAMYNGAVHEKSARAALTARWDIPVICGHELFSELNSIQRSASTLLNTRLLPIVDEFLRAVRISLAERGIKAPVVIVRSDGSLMSEVFTKVRPVETLLCGPASSVMGGMALCGEENSIVVDMGGTTTDIAMVKDGVPIKATDGINIGKWRTFVKGVFIDTFGLGGDSAVRYDKNGKLRIESTRVMPISIAARRWPAMLEKLEILLYERGKHTRWLHEFFCLVKDVSDNENYTETERQFCRALKKEPLILTEAAEAVGTDIYNLKMDRLEKEGVVIRCGLTPTDIMHIKGDYNRYSTKGAELAAEFVAHSTSLSVEALCDWVYNRVKKTLYTNIVRMLMESQYPYIRKNGVGKRLGKFISQSWDRSLGHDRSFLDFNFHTEAALIGVGAPIHIFLPDVAKALGTRCVVPENAAVANALGALIGNISATCEIEVKADYSMEGIDGYIVYGRNGNTFAEDIEEAEAIAKKEAEAGAREEAALRGAGDELTVETQLVVNRASAYQSDIFMGMKAVATAMGRIAL